MLRFTLLTILTLTILAPPPSWAETTPDAPAAAKFKSWDSDGDGKLSRAEWQGPQQRFQKLDGDGDGFVSLDELSSTPATAPAQNKAKAQSQEGMSCQKCNEQWHQCMVGKAGFLKQRCDEAMFRCEEKCQK